VRIQGLPPLPATVYELEKLRCNLCVKVFTANAPEGIGEEKYDETAVSMIGCLKYGAGFPFHRLEKLEKNLGIPLPAATQWDLVKAAAERLQPIYQAIIDEAAQDELHGWFECQFEEKRDKYGLARLRRECPCSRSQCRLNRKPVSIAKPGLIIF
jgi:hypothetical protein